MRKLTLEERLDILEYKILEKRLNNIEKSLDKKFNKSLKNEYNKRTNERGLLRGVVGKVNANVDDADELVSILRDKFKVKDSCIKVDKNEFGVHIDFYNTQELLSNIDAAAKELSLDKKIVVNRYDTDIKEVDNKISISITKVPVVWTNQKVSYSNKTSVIGEKGGLNMLSMGGLAKSVVDLLKEKLGKDVIEDMASFKEASASMNDSIKKMLSEYAGNIIKELKANSVFKNIDWAHEISNGSVKITGIFNLRDSGNETGTYKVIVNLADGKVTLYNATEQNTVAFVNIGDTIYKAVDKVISSNLKNRGKMEAGEYDYSKDK